MDNIVILDNIRSTFNVGSIFRTSDGAGIKKIYLVGITPEPTHIKIIKTALGAQDYVEWEHTNSIEEIIKKLKNEGYEIISVEQSDKSLNYKTISLKSKSAFIFGNEITGVNPATLTLSDKIIDIPMRGKKNSLNVATTVGIILYHFMR